jgi:fructose-1-phosphate kinase PfkB-like protein
MPNSPLTSTRDFSAIQADLENITTKLKPNLDQESKREFLRELRALLEEADLALISGTQQHVT